MIRLAKNCHLRCITPLVCGKLLIRGDFFIPFGWMIIRFVSNLFFQIVGYDFKKTTFLILNGP